MSIHLPPGITVRPARPDDRAPLAAIAATVWEGNDYLTRVFDEWLATPDSAFFVAEAPAPVAGSAVVGCVRGALVAPGEGWVEGLRVHPDARGRGYAHGLLEAATNWCMSHGARATRFVTEQRTAPVVQIAATLGYRLAIRYVPTSAPAALDGGAGHPLPALEPVAPRSVRSHWARLSLSGLAGAADSFLTRGWHVWEINVQLLEEQARADSLYYLPAAPLPATLSRTSLAPEPGWVGAGAPRHAGPAESGALGVLRLNERGFLQLGWVAGPAGAIRGFGHAARRAAAERGIEAVTTLVPEGTFVERPLTEAGFVPRGDGRALLYEYRVEWC